MIWAQKRRWATLAVLAATAAPVHGHAARPSSAKAPARDDAGGPSAGREDLSVTISGGASLGVYLAGFMYMTSEALKRQGEWRRLRLLTGASAGSINAVTTAMNLCRPLNPDPTQDLGWRVWMSLDYRQLFVPEEVTAVSLFSRRSMREAAQKIGDLWQAGLREDCDIVVGVTATRLEPLPVRVHENFQIPRQEEKFAFRIRGRGPGRPPLVENYVDPFSRLAQPLLPFATEADGEAAIATNFDRIRDLLFASSAVPIAFAPQLLQYCMTTPPSSAEAGATSTRCTEPVSEALFVDGGVFDNSPLRFAHRLADTHLRRDEQGASVWRDLHTAPDTDPRPPVDDIYYVYIDPTRHTFPPMTDELRILGESKLLPLAAKMLLDFVQTARSKELQTLVEESPDLSLRMRMTEGSYPKASEHLGGFSGAFEGEFRRFDFYLGMYDAYRDLRQRRGEAIDLTEQMEAADGSIVPVWKPFACMLGWFEEGLDALRSACAGDDLIDFRILMQTAIDRVYSHCSKLTAQRIDEAARNRHCVLASNGETPPHIDGVTKLETRHFLREDDEIHLTHTLRLLSGYGFHFKDLGLTREESQHGRIKLRRKLLKMLKAIAGKQDAPSRTLILTGGRAIINQIAYEPPRHWAYAVIGSGLEIGASVLPFDWNYSFARINLALQAKGLQSLLSQETSAVSLSAVAGPELELLFITTPYVQPILGFRAGYQLSNRDRFNGLACKEIRALADGRNCNQPVLQSYIALGIVERLRLQITLEAFPFKPKFGDRYFDLLFGVGVHMF